MTKKQIFDHHFLSKIIYCLRYKNIAPSNKGATSVEFALIIIPLMMLIVGTLQNFLVATAKLTLDSALQTIAYDAANASSADVSKLLSRKNLCDQSALFLVNCNTSTDFCFAIMPLEFVNTVPKPIRTCQTSTAPAALSGCCYQIMVEYQIPTIFDFTRQFLFMANSVSAPRMMYSVAFVYRT